MNAAAQTFAIALASVVAAAAIGIGLADSMAAPTAQVMQVTVVRLPRVVIEQPRAASPAVTLAQARPARTL
ncbi:hypothetical protein [Roseateles sp.]|uniref:hypothetical protein n=1 Tax=Roseateles sp. TaxID=1971397 RepID=UPI0025EDAC19|nr:hypothetical protein [Roseateles sp.]MBV8035380.1 hypothetical protein [Roseateles sp.]